MGYLNTSWFKSKHSQVDQLKEGMLVPQARIAKGIFGWVYNNDPVFVFEKQTDIPQNWQVHFTHQCGYAADNNQWISNTLNSQFSFTNNKPLAFCPDCVSLVDRLFDETLAQKGLENTYDPAEFFENLVQSFPYLFWHDAPQLSKHKTHRFTAIKPKNSAFKPCQKCDQDTQDALTTSSDDASSCIHCLTFEKQKNLALDYKSIAEYYKNKRQEHNQALTQWHEVEPFLPAIWARLLQFFNYHELPIPLLWHQVKSKCDKHTLTLPIYWPDLGKAVVMETPDTTIEWPDDIEYWSFFDMLRQ